jgi:transposase
MVDGIILSEKSKEELIEIIKGLYKENEELKQKVKEQQQRNIEKFVKENVKKKRRMRPGQKMGHVGITRPLPDHIDEVFEQELSACPHCRNHLKESIEVIEHVQEDIIPARVVVRKYRRHRYYCACCQKVVTAAYHPTQVPEGRLGANVLIQAAILKYYHCLPYRKIASLMQDMCGLKISPSALAQALQRISRWLEVEEKVILEAIRGSPRVHIDETGWRLDGKNHWLWAFINELMAYYKIEPSRARRIVKEVLPEGIQRTIITDFYGVYFNLPYKRQKCLVHLLREFRSCSQSDGSLEYQENYKKIKRLFNDAIRLHVQNSQLPEETYLRRVKWIKMRLFIFMHGNYHNKNLQRLCKRFSKFWLDMFVFLEDPKVAWNNNLAERMIRPNVIYRNRSFGNRSKAGAQAHATFMSLIQTLILQKQDVADFLKKSFIAHRQGSLLPLLSIPLQ